MAVSQASLRRGALIVFIGDFVFLPVPYVSLIRALRAGRMRRMLPFSTSFRLSPDLYHFPRIGEQNSVEIDAHARVIPRCRVGPN